jgi:signal transduction histidine kinase
LQTFVDSREEADVESDRLFYVEAERVRSLEKANLRLRGLEQACRQAYQHAITAQEAERKRIAAELHDDTSQSLAALVVGLDTAEAMLERNPAGVRGQLAHLKRLAGAIIDEIDVIIGALRPTLLDDLGLVPALRAYAADRLDPLGVTWELDAGSSDCPQRPVDLVLFRVVQEAISNIARHAQAQHVRIALRHEAGGIAVQVCDDGAGFDLSAVLDPHRRPPSFGLLGMQERLAAIDGWLDIESRSGEGTQLRIFVPCTAEGGTV